MKIEKVLDLIEKGFKAKTLSKLSETQIEVLHNKLVLSEQIQEIPNKKTYKVGPKGGKIGDVMISQDPNTKEVMVTTETEMTEDDQLDQDIQNKDYGDTDQEEKQLGPADYGDNPSKDKQMDDNNVDGMGMMENTKKTSEESNPWAICTAQLGKEFGTRERHLWSAKEKNKYERCVKDVKKSLKESKDSLSLYLESQVMKLVEKNIPPKITKGDLIKYLSEAPSPAPAEPTTKPGTKPKTRPDTRPKPKHPGKNPNPGEKPAPKARKTPVSPEKAKDEVIDMIMKLLKK